MMDKKTNGVPKFSIKSASLLLLASVIGGILIPYLFFELNWDTRLATMIFLPILIAGAIAYSQCFIETKKGISKSFWITFIIAFIILEVLSYFWLYKGFIF